MNPEEENPFDSFSRNRSLMIDPDDFKDLDEVEENVANFSNGLNSSNPQRQSHQHSSYVLEMEMEKHQKQLDLVQEIMEEIKSFTDFYALPVAEYLTDEGIEEFLSLMKQI